MSRVSPIREPNSIAVAVSQFRRTLPGTPGAFADVRFAPGGAGHRVRAGTVHFDVVSGAGKRPASVGPSFTTLITPHPDRLPGNRTGRPNGSRSGHCTVGSGAFAGRRII